MLKWNDLMRVNFCAIPTLVIQCLACAGVAWIVARGWWSITTPHSATQPPPAFATLKDQSGQVMARHFFDVAGNAENLGSGASIAPPVSAGSNWRLLGTYVDPDHGSSALLAQEGSTEVVFVRVGNELAGGLKVLDVQNDSVGLGADTEQTRLTLRPAPPNGHEQAPPQEWASSSRGMQQPTGPVPYLKDPR